MEPKTPRKRGPAKQFGRQLSLYENDEGMDLLEQLSQRLGQTQAGTLRQLVREKAKELGIRPG